ncbi:MAG: hypothetical protein AAF228_07590 [Pseudomonadota bacterium]
MDQREILWLSFALWGIVLLGCFISVDPLLASQTELFLLSIDVQHTSHTSYNDYEGSQYHGLTNSETFSQFKEGISYVFRNLDLIVVFVAIAYTWLYVDTITIVLTIALTVLGVYVTVTYIDVQLIKNVNFLRAGLFFIAGLVTLLSAERNNRILPVLSVPLGILSTLFIIKTAPHFVVDQDFINGAFVGILLIIFLGMAIWYAVEENWFLKVLQRTFGTFLLVAGVVAFGLAMQ